MKIITKSDNSRRRIAAVGMYDGVHLGHRFLLDFLKAEADKRGLTPAAITFVHHPLRVVRPLEAPALLNPPSTRVRALGDAGAEDVILMQFNDSLRRMSASEFLSMLKRKYAVDALVLGFNNRFGHDGPSRFDDYRRLGAELGIEVVAAPEYRGPCAPVSSSAIRRLLLQGEPKKAAEALGRPYRLRGLVVHGEELGRRLGFPTANIEPDEPEILIPRAGAYAAYIITPDGERRPGMVNIGFRPSVDHGDNSGRLAIEAHIFDYKGYLYDEELTVEFIDFMRGESRFASSEKLAEQLKRDAAKARKVLARER